MKGWTDSSCMPSQELLIIRPVYIIYTVEYRQSAPHRLSAPPPPPLFFHIERIGIVNAPPLVYPPPPPFPSVLLPVISHPTLPPCIMKCQNVPVTSLGERGRLYLHDAHGMIVHDPVGVAVVVRQWRGYIYIHILSIINYYI